MANKIVFIHGSPRKKGNTRSVSVVAIEAAKACGAEVAEIDAVKLRHKKPGCTGCQKCQQSEAFVCAIDDEVGRVVATFPDYDVIVMATPLYWWSYSAQIKIVIDRMYSLSKFTADGDVHTPLKGKTLALLATAGGPLEENLELLERQWKNPAEMLGCAFHSCLFPFAPWEPGALIREPGVAEKARAFGELLAAAEI